MHWVEGGHARSAHWRSERGAPPPRRVVLADDTLTAAMAQRLASEGTAMLWRGDFHNARQLLQALARRIDQPKGARKSSYKQEQTIYTSQAQKAKKASNFGSDGLAVPPSPTSPTEASVSAAAFHRHRQAQSQRARLLGMVLLSFGPDHGLALRRAPDVRQACAQGWGEPTAEATGSVASLRELLALTSAHEWARQGVEVPALGEAPLNRIHPRYGVFSPVRGEYVALVAQAPLPGAADTLRAFDIGTGSGVLAAVLARRGVAQVVATDLDERALACARANLQRLAPGVQLLRADLFPPGRAHLVVCNPPWLPARATSPVERAVYDEDSRMLRGFLAGLANHLLPGGEGWLIMSDLAEHLGLRRPHELADWVAAAGLRVVARLDARPTHRKAADTSDPLHAARAAEVTSLWRLAVGDGGRGAP